MPINITGMKVSWLDRDSLRKKLESVLSAEGAPLDWDLNVKLVDDNEISACHVKWMGIEGATDVISFPLDLPDDPDVMEGCLGDVVVSIDTAVKQASDAGHSAAIEVNLLAVHGTLHILGYDDIDESDRKVIRSKERQYVPEAFREDNRTV